VLPPGAAERTTKIDDLEPPISQGRRTQDPRQHGTVDLGLREEHGIALEGRLPIAHGTGRGHRFLENRRIVIATRLRAGFRPSQVVAAERTRREQTPRAAHCRGRQPVACE
jgi:hypothetical protein